MSRISQEIKTKIKNRLLTAAMEVEKRNLDAQENRVAMMVYHQRYTAEQRKVMDSLPDRWLPMSGLMEITYNGRNIGLSLRPNYVRVPYCDSHCSSSCCRVNCDEHAHIKAAVADFLQSTEDYKDRKDKLNRDINSALAAINTPRHMEQNWPEVYPILKELMRIPDKSVAPLAVLDYSRLNRELGIGANATPQE